MSEAADVKVHRVGEDSYVVADAGGWLPGHYPSERMALAAAECDFEALKAWWHSIILPETSASSNLDPPTPA
jgi:hypothetical protein